MKKRRSFVKRHTISIGILVIVAIFSVRTTLQKQDLYDKLVAQGDDYIAEIDELERTLKEYQNELEQVDTLEFVEQYARETLKMVSPDEIYYQIYFTDEE
jgi:cell division protein FtsB